MRTRYKFEGRDSRGFYVWESVLPMPGDSRHERITCSPTWFWHPPIVRRVSEWHDPRCDSDWCHPECPIRLKAIEDDRPYPGRRTR